MTYKKIRVLYRTPFSSLPTADQLFGQIVWAISDLYGVQRAKEFVAGFDGKPPFLISAVIPEGFLPLPFYPPPSQIVATSSSERQKAKQNKKRKWIPLNSFYVLQHDPTQMRFLDFADSGPAMGEVVEEHVQIDRNTLRAADGTLHAERYLFGKIPFVAYVAFDEERESDMGSILAEVCSYLGVIGLGGNRNVGKGACDVSCVELSEEERKLFSFHNGNPQSFMTLSRCSGKDLLDGAVAYSLTAYSGITGRSTSGFFNKKPVVGFEVGSTFRSGTGGLVHGVNPDEKVCTYAYAFPVPLSLEVFT